MADRFKSLVAAVTIGIAVAGFSAAGSAEAEVLNYTISGTGSGFVGSQAFTDAAFTISMFGDTALIAPVPDGGLALDPLDLSQVTIAGLGTTDILIHTRLGENPSVPVIFFSLGGAQSQDFFDFAVPTVIDLAHPFGPVAGTAPFVAQFNQVQSSLGDLTFTASSDVIFQAVAVPEPATWATMALGLLGLSAAAAKQRHRMRRRSTWTALHVDRFVAWC